MKQLYKVTFCGGLKVTLGGGKKTGDYVGRQRKGLKTTSTEQDTGPDWICPGLKNKSSLTISTKREPNKAINIHDSNPQGACPHYGPCLFCVWTFSEYLRSKTQGWPSTDLEHISKQCFYSAFFCCCSSQKCKNQRPETGSNGEDISFFQLTRLMEGKVTQSLYYFSWNHFYRRQASLLSAICGQHAACLKAEKALGVLECTFITYRLVNALSCPFLRKYFLSQEVSMFDYL